MPGAGTESIFELNFNDVPNPAKRFNTIQLTQN